MFQPCSPIWVTQPIWTSSISPGSSLDALDERVQHLAASSSPRTVESVLLLPIGDRTASTISASDFHLPMRQV